MNWETDGIYFQDNILCFFHASISTCVLLHARQRRCGSEDSSAPLFPSLDTIFDSKFLIYIKN